MRGTHSIADIAFGETESALICCCGWDTADADPDGMAEAFQRHRVALGEPRRIVSGLIGKGLDNEFFNAQSGSVKTVKKRVTTK